MVEEIWQDGIHFEGLALYPIFFVDMW